jgi:peroxiredoxin
LWAGRAGFVVLVLAVFTGVRLYQQRSLIEAPAPRLEGRLVDGTAYAPAGRETQPLLVYFWASWCPVCRLEQGGIDTLAREQRVVTVAMQSGADAEVTNFLREHGLQFPVINDPDGTLAAAWGVRGVPTFIVVDSQGMIRFREVGYTTALGLRWRLWRAG